MSGQPDLARSVAQWASKADHDFRNAEYTLTLQEDCPFDTACFHAQQQGRGMPGRWQPRFKPEGRKMIAHGVSRWERNARSAQPRTGA